MPATVADNAQDTSISEKRVEFSEDMVGRPSHTKWKELRKRINYLLLQEIDVPSEITTVATLVTSTASITKLASCQGWRITRGKWKALWLVIKKGIPRNIKKEVLLSCKVTVIPIKMLDDDHRSRDYC